MSGGDVKLLERDLAEYQDVVARDAVDGGPVIQTESLAFSDEQFRISRGNFSITRGFRVTKEFANNKDSAEWYEKAAETFGGVYDVEITHKDYAGVETPVAINNAAITVSASEPIGVCVQATIHITGGKVAESINQPMS